MLAVKRDWTLPKPACLVPAPHFPTTALHRAQHGKPGHLAEPAELSAGGGKQEGVSHPTQFKKKEKWEGGEGGKRGRSIEIAILAKEIHKSGSKIL